MSFVNDENLTEKIEADYENVKSFYKFQKELKNRKMISNPTQVTVSERIDLVFKNGQPSYESVKDKVCLMPLREQIKSFLQIPKIINSMIDNIHFLENDSQHKNFFNGILWQNIKSAFEQNEIIIPCFLYHDDFEPDNPLSSNAGANKIAAFYYSFPGIPQHFNSSPKYIFDAMVFNSALKKHEFDSALKPLVDEFKELEKNGIMVEIDGKITKVFVVLCLTIGDNLAQNELLGFNTSFNATYSCRFCLTPKSSTKIDTKIKDETIRNQNNYFDDLEKCQHGIVKECPLSELSHFEVTKNYSVDIMHDIFEGVARYDIALFLKYIIYEHKIIDLWTLNKLKQEFDYGAIEIGNMGPPITENSIKANYIIMSASEMRNFLHFLPLMIGHKINDKKHLPVWDFICGLILIADISMKSKFTEQDSNNIDNLIKTYLKRRLNLFQQSLKPKHHLMLHYKTCIDYTGPIRNFMCFSYEQKNKDVKKHGKVSHQRINLSWTLLSKQVMKYNKFISQHRQQLYGCQCGSH